MKGLIFAITIVCLLIVSSCSKKKDWTCICTAAGLGGITDTTEYLDINKADAKKLCQEKIFGISTGCILNEVE